MYGRIVRIISNLYTVEVNEKLYDCNARGKFRNENITPVVGDICKVDLENKYILEIQPRKNELDRPMIANVSKALVLTSVKKPDLSLNLLDKQLAVIIYNKITPIIIFSKLDLLNSNELKEIKRIGNYYKKIGFEVYKNTYKAKIKKAIKNNLVVVTGQTGSGKSTLLNRLEKELNLNTSPISESLGRGVHTTRHVELFKIGKGLIADTPGFSSINLNNMTLDDLKSTFIEFSNYNCLFKDCKHINEKDCAVKEAVNKKQILKSRYENYVKFSKEVS